MFYIVIFLFLFLTNSSSGQNYPNIENQMLSNSLNSFLYYESKNFPNAFSDPNSLRDTEMRSQLSDQYHDSLHYQNNYYNNSRTRINQINNRLNMINIIYIDKRPIIQTNPYKFSIP